MSVKFSFVLYDNNEILYTSEELELVIHELLSYVKHTLFFLMNNKINIKNISFDNFKIVEQTRENNKRFSYSKNTYFFDFKLCKIVNLDVPLSETNNQVLEDIRYFLCDGHYIKQIDLTKSEKSKEENKEDAKIAIPLTKEKDKEKEKQDDKIKDIISKTINMMEDVNKSLMENINIIPQIEKVEKDKKILIISDSEDTDISESESEFKYVHSESEDEEEIKKKIEFLEELKKRQEEEIIHARDKILKKKEEIAKEFCDLSWEESEIRKKKEDDEVKKRIFNADIDIYYKIKFDVLEHGIDIPILFQSKYPIFKFMDDKEILGEEEAYKIYKMLNNALYSQDTETDEEIDELVLEFLDSLDKSRKYKTYEEIMEELNTEENDCLFEQQNHKEENIINTEEHKEKLKKLAKLLE